ncbi:MAG: hypothetical protein QOF83_1562 [Solirubrobacteraceae bacterium]|jgi:hypothetical protein|nr:hypothetical protein [Solirubrobacteraceae bacterium]
MVVIVSVETLLLLVLLVLVAGLLRSHAEILRRLEDGAGASPGGPLAQPAAPARVPGAPASALAGPTPDGDALALDFAGRAGEPTLLAFMTSGCTTCAGFWATLGEARLPAGVRTVVVTHGEERERPAKLRALAPEGVPVIMSSQAWRDYSVPASPYFVLVDGSVRGEGAATSWSALASLVSDAIEDQRESSDGTARAAAAEGKLAAAGIGPDHPSLYPGRAPARP